LVIGFAYTDLDTNGDDFLLTYQITPGVGFATLSVGGSTTVTEILCSTPTTPSTCTGTKLNQSNLSVNTQTGSTTFASSAVSLAGTDYVLKDITGGSNVVQSFVPEPVTSSLLGLGLLAIGFAGRKRLRKD
jgi:hypothetical protein